VTGQLSQIHFSEGQEVRKGAPLFTLDSRPFQAALQQAEAILARDTAQAKNAMAQLGRFEDLYKRGLIPRDQFETQSATASALEATLAADRSQVENARLNMQYTRIVAPIAGRTGALGVHQGDLVRANDSAPLVVINQLAPIYVTFAVAGRFLPEIRAQHARKPLRIEVLNAPGDAPGVQQTGPTTPDGGTPTGAAGAAPGPTAEGARVREGGVVTFIDNTVDPTTGTIKLKGTVDNTSHALWPGLFVQVTLVLSTDPNALVVPAAAVQISQTGQYVFVVKQDQTVEQRPVTVERQQGEEMVISKGLTAGEQVVTDGHLRLTAGSRITTGGRGDEPGVEGGGRGNGEGRRGDDGAGRGGPAGQGSGTPDGAGTGRRGNREGRQP
jgi:multidrug efflux system membrane fusion protein